MSSLHLATVYALLEEFPGSKQIAKAHLTRLKTLLGNASKGRYGRIWLLLSGALLRILLGPVCLPNPWNCNIPSGLFRELDAEIAEIEAEIETMMDKIQSPITTIPGMGFRMAAMILAEIGDFSRLSHRTNYWPTPNVAFYLPVRAAQKLLSPHGEAWLSILTLRSLQRSQVCLSLGPNLCCLPC